MATSDLDELEEPVAAVLLELPERELGGLLPAWDDLVASCARTRAKGAAVHLDGARLWQCGPFYERGLDEIAGLFDTVYVSFYKDLAAPAGAALAGPADFIEEARVWQVRHGGRLYSVHPYLIAAERGLDEILPRIPELVAHARELGTALAALDGIEIVPDPPQTTMFHLYVHRPLEPLQEAALDQAEQTGTFLGFIRATDRPEVQRLELTIGPASLEVPVAEARALWQELLAATDVPVAFRRLGTRVRGGALASSDGGLSCHVGVPGSGRLASCHATPAPLHRPRRDPPSRPAERRWTARRRTANGPPSAAPPGLGAVRAAPPQDGSAQLGGPGPQR